MPQTCPRGTTMRSYRFRTLIGGLAFAGLLCGSIVSAAAVSNGATAATSCNAKGGTFANATAAAKVASPTTYQFAVDQGATIAATPDGCSFFVFWSPAG